MKNWSVKLKGEDYDLDYLTNNFSFNLNLSILIEFEIRF